ADNAGKLPGSNEQDDRAMVAQQFTLLSQLLPALNGPDMPGDFRQQLRIVESTRSLLSGGSMDLAPEPTIHSGLRAPRRARRASPRRPAPRSKRLTAPQGPPPAPAPAPAPTDTPKPNEAPKPAPTET